MTTKQTMIRVPTPTDKKLTEQAKIRGMTKNGLINYIISDFLQQHTTQSKQRETEKIKEG